MENRNCYGWYGINGGYTGETAPVKKPNEGNRYSLNTYRFELFDPERWERNNHRDELKKYCYVIHETNCKTYDNALKNVKRVCKQNGYTLLRRI